MTAVAEAPKQASTATKPRTTRRTLSRRKRREYLTFVLLALPNVVLIAVFTYRPLFANIAYSTLDWTLGAPTAVRIGLGNYVEFFTSSESLGVLATTAIFTLATVGGSMIIGLLVALALNLRVAGRSAARAIVFAPYVLSGVGVGLVWLFIFDPTYGALASILRGIGVASPQWINNPRLALVMLIIVYVWKNLGYAAVVYLGGLQSVSADVLEAASLDGAGAARRFFSVTLPLLSPTTFFLLVTTTLSSLQAFDLIKIMTPSGQGTTTLMFDVYLQAFGGYNRAGFSAAVSVILFAILLAVTVVQFRFVERRVHY